MLYVYMLYESRSNKDLTRSKENAGEFFLEKVE